MPSRPRLPARCAPWTHVPPLPPVPGKTIGKVITTSSGTSSFDALSPPSTPGSQLLSGAAAAGRRGLGAVSNVMARLSFPATKSDKDVSRSSTPEADKYWVSPVCLDVITLLCHGINDPRDTEASAPRVMLYSVTCAGQIRLPACTRCLVGVRMHLPRHADVRVPPACVDPPPPPMTAHLRSSSHFPRSVPPLCVASAAVNDRVACPSRHRPRSADVAVHLPLLRPHVSSYQPAPHGQYQPCGDGPPRNTVFRDAAGVAWSCWGTRWEE